MTLKGAVIGGGYFSQFHFDAWRRMDEVELLAVCDIDSERARAAQSQFNIGRSYTDIETMLDRESLDFVDIITPPETHFSLCRMAAAHDLAIICQKPLAPDRDEALRLVQELESSGTRFMVHENFRFQPWHREIRHLLDNGAIGDRLHTMEFRLRTGDGWGDDAYLERQPYFREYPRLLIYETGVHFVDVFRYLAGEVNEVYSRLRKLNPVIAGEDCGLVLFEFASGAQGIWNANRYNEPDYDHPRYTFGEFLLEGNRGSIRLKPDGSMFIQPLGAQSKPHQYEHHDRGFAGDCVLKTQKHFIHCLHHDLPFETAGTDYLQTLAVQEAIYRSSERNTPVRL